MQSSSRNATKIRYYRVLSAVIAALIVYGCLYPWRFIDSPGNPFTRLLQSRPPQLLRFAIRDIVVNIAIYVPLGAALYLSFGRGWSRRSAATAAVGTAAGLSYLVECAQTAVAGRVSSIFDVAYNTIGAVFGAVSIAVLHARGFLRGKRTQALLLWRDRAAFLIIVLAVVWMLFPLFPVLGRTALTAKLSKFWSIPTSPWTALTGAAATVVVCGKLLDAGGMVRPAVGLACGILLIPLQICVMTRQSTWIDFTGALAGLGIWACIAPRVTTSVTAVIAIGLVAGRQLMPFDWQPTVNAMQWAPLSGALAADWVNGLVSLLAKGFYYSAAVWALRRTGTPLVVTGGAILALTAVTEALQQYLVGRTPEISDPLIALGAALMLKVLDTPHQTA